MLRDDRQRHAAISAHDVRQLLGGILALTSAARCADERDTVHDLLERIDELAATAAEALAPCLPTLPSARLDEVAQRVGEIAALTHGVDVDLELSPACVRGDGVTWWRIAANLTDNACRAAGRGGRVGITLRVDGDRRRAVLSVVDSGPGFGQCPAGEASLGLMTVIRETHRCGGAVEFHPLAHGVLVRLVVPLA